MNQETQRSEAIGTRAKIWSTQEAGTITSSETRRELAWSAPPALNRYSLDPSIPTTAADKMPMACVDRTPEVVRARARTRSPISNRLRGEDREGRGCKGVRALPKGPRKGRWGLGRWAQEWRLRGPRVWRRALQQSGGTPRAHLRGGGGGSQGDVWRNKNEAQYLRRLRGDNTDAGRTLRTT